MDTSVVEACLIGSVNGTMAFPEIVGNLLAAGVERYTVDLVALDHRAYGRDGKVHTVPLVLNAAGTVSEAFDGAGVQAAIRDAQQGRVKYPEFVTRVTAAGVATYTAYLTGRQVIYSGRLGDAHREPFPSQP